MNINNLSLMIILISIVLLFAPIYSQNSTCHYTCTSCTTPAYYDCLSCPLNRGISSIPYTPFAGMCYCSGQTDQNDQGLCLTSATFNHNNKSLIFAFISLSIILSFFMLIIRGFRYFFIKTIQDIQQLSIIVFINMYFPQQFDIFLTQLYRFNISSFLFQSMTSGGLYTVDQSGAVVSNDGTEVEGKYKLLMKSANFFSNMFTWTIVAIILIGITIGIRCVKNKLIEQNRSIQKIGQQKVNNHMNASQASINNIQNNQSFIISQIQSNYPQKNQIIKQKYQIKNQSRNPYQYTLSNLVIKFNNILSYNFLIIFFYLSLIQININILTQFNNVTFKTGFAAIGSILAAIFLGLQCIGLVLLFIKCKNQLLKPQWMQDYSYSALHYLIRTNYKSLTKYFFFWTAIKKILFALIIVAFYNSPSDAIIGYSALQVIFLCLSIYLQPFQKRYIRIHFYLCQTLKLFLFISLINFVQKYKQFTKLIQVTQIVYFILACIFGFHFVSILLCLIIQWKVYWHETKQIYKKINRSCGNNNNSQSYTQSKQNNNDDKMIGYFHYVIQKQQNETQPTTPKVDNNNKQLKQLSQIDHNNDQKLHHQQKQNNKKQEQQQNNQQWKKYFYLYKNYQFNYENKK